MRCSPGEACASMSPAGFPYVHAAAHMESLMSKPLIISIPHRLGREEAARRIKSGLATARAHYSTFVTIGEETWNGDRLDFKISMLGQGAAGLMDFADDHVRLELTLPGLLGMIAEALTPMIRKDVTLMLEKK
jgi:Putative polyhydroxyalkanoic acid system protein (PHA_gran_rgn)